MAESDALYHLMMKWWSYLLIAEFLAIFSMEFSDLYPVLLLSYQGKGFSVFVFPEERIEQRDRGSLSRGLFSEAKVHSRNEVPQGWVAVQEVGLFSEALMTPSVVDRIATWEKMAFSSQTMVE